MARSNRGFTIVELLIVIVVIGILAALALNTFSGVQKKARNTKTISNIRQYYTAIELYKANKGYYPKTPGEGVDEIAMVCLGMGYPGDNCGKISGSVVYESQAFTDELLSTIGGGLGSDVINSIPGTVGEESFIGAAYGIDKWINGGKGRTIQWFLEGSDQSCQLPKSYAYRSSKGNTACEMALEPYPPVQ